jgi:arylsulfatase A-like enzyme
MYKPTILILIAAFVFFQCSTLEPKEESNIPKPNIIFIMADDLGYADLGCYGQNFIQTPNIDQLASEGVRFTRVYTGSTVCAPSRSVLMTGQHLGHTTVRGNSSPIVKSESNPQGRVPLLDKDITVAEVLKNAGYVTGMTGKWGLGEPGTSGLPNKQGFDEWFGYLNQRRAHNYYTEYLWKNEEKVELPGNQNGGEAQYSHDLMTEFALDFIQKHRDTTFFLYIPYTIPHDEYEVPDYSQYKDQPWEEREKIFAAMVSRLDGDIGKIVELLSKLGLDQNTLVFFCSDNGAAQRWEGVFDSSGHLRGRKRDMYEGGIRTPMIVWYPGKIKPIVNREDVWYFADVMPTLASIANIDPPKNIDGINVWPSILGKKSIPDERFLYWEFYEGRFGQAVRWKNWKAVKNDIDLPWELYDLSVDESETKDISSTNQDVLNIIKDWVNENRVESPYWSSGLE